MAGSKKQTKARLAKIAGFVADAPERTGLTQSDIVVHSASAGRDVNIAHTITHRQIVEAKPGTENISQKQCLTLRELIVDIVEASKTGKRKPVTFPQAYVALHKACGVVSYKLIPLEQFDYARDYLYKWRGRITASRMAKRAHPEQRRDQDVRYINAKAKQHDF